LIGCVLLLAACVSGGEASEASAMLAEHGAALPEKLSELGL